MRPIFIHGNNFPLAFQYTINSFYFRYKMSKNKARDIERKVKAIEKNVTEAWEKYQNPNIFGGGPVIDPQGKIVSLNIKAYGHVAAFFEQESVQRELREAVRKNNLEFAGYDQENVDT